MRQINSLFVKGVAMSEHKGLEELSRQANKLDHTERNLDKMGEDLKKTDQLLDQLEADNDSTFCGCFQISRASPSHWWVDLVECFYSVYSLNSNRFYVLHSMQWTGIEL